MYKILCTAGLAFVFCVGVAQAETCAQKIAQLEKRIKRNPEPGGATLPESTFATMHRQPTQETVANAMRQSDADTLDDARLLNAEGKEKECLAKIKPLEQN
jgi:hypothetical protein